MGGTSQSINQGITVGGQSRTGNGMTMDGGPGTFGGMSLQSQMTSGGTAVSANMVSMGQGSMDMDVRGVQGINASGMMRPNVVGSNDVQ